ncbi:MAG: LON peptidase substrate-binding domain-containing protein, partial [Deltaproteobacteria bacterium]|nr:LON peptidase substrate-binding domain-containing protein [Deltaproteobacteria bacterium]
MTEPSQAMDFGTEKIPDNLSILPLFDTVLFPKMVLPFVVMQENSLRLIDDAMSKDRIIGFIASKQPIDSKTESESKDDLYGVGTSALILKMAKIENNKAQLLVQGLGRFRIKEYNQTEPYLLANVVHIEDEKKTGKEVEALTTN